MLPVAYPQGWQGDASPRFQAGGQSCKSPPPHFLTHDDAIAGFTSQSLGLPTYAYKRGSSTAIKLPPRMHQNLQFWAPKIQKFSGEGTPDASFLTLAMIRPPLFKPWIRSCILRRLCSIPKDATKDAAPQRSASGVNEPLSICRCLIDWRGPDVTTSVTHVSLCQVCRLEWKLFYPFSK